MNVRDPHFTARLEEALRLLARQPSLPLAYLARRFNLEAGQLSEWLGEFNAGSKTLKADRIDAVKTELGGLKAQRAEKPAVPLMPPAAADSARNVVMNGNASAPAAKPAIAAKLQAPTSDLGSWLQAQRAEITDRVNCFQVRVTPELANAWLVFNLGNRKPSRAKLRRFSAAMIAGKWALNGETVKFSKTGRLLDGQSRLLAIAAANVPVVLEVRAGLPDIAQQSMDAGELRKGAHMLEMIGEANPAILAAALKIMWVWSKGWIAGYAFGASRVMENSEIGPLLEQHTGLKMSAGWTVSDGAKVDRFMPRSEAAFFHYLLGTADAKARDAFFEALIDGLGLTRASPVYHLRERLTADRTGLDTKQKKMIRRGLVIKAWNATIRAESMKRLTFDFGDEAFPDIEGVPPPERQKAVERRNGGDL